MINKSFELPASSTLRPGILFPRLFRTLSKGDTILAAVSGGADSMGLLSLLMPPEPERNRLVVGHIHHGTGEFADNAEVMVQQFCREHAIKFICERVEIDSNRRKQVGFEAAAREVRYQALERIGEAHHAVSMLTAHTRDDVVENFIMMAMRGAGLTGLAGLRPERGGWRRPLLQMTRDEIRRYVQEQGVQFIDDPANDDSQFTRVQVRKQLVPVIREVFGDSAVDNISRSVSHLRESDECLDAIADQLLEKAVSRRSPGWVSIDAGELHGYLDELVVRVLRRVIALVRNCSLHDVYLSREDRSRLIELTRRPDTGQRETIAGVTVSDHGELEFTVHTSETRIPATLPGEWDLPDGSRVIVTADNVNQNGSPSVQRSENPGYVERFDATSLGNRVTFRPWQPGDRFTPLGKASGEVSVTRRLRRASRERIGPLWVMETGKNDIAWVLGERIADPYKVTDRTQNIWIFRYTPPANLARG